LREGPASLPERSVLEVVGQAGDAAGLIELTRRERPVTVSTSGCRRSFDRGPGGRADATRYPPATCNALGPASWKDGCVQLRCVIVDDDENFLDVARASLERGGVIVAGVADSRAAAVQRVTVLRPDIVLVDIRLGAESGFDVARDLAASGHAGRLIMISSYAEADYADLIAEAPVAGFLPKTQLSAVAIRRVLGMA
jgi:CheY-like chemotaxis protein